ncbi:Bug family tripartite tricarboxylate transporter substrate binding protein [Roseomonas sp. CCTCC AB2023176]|uniref:Bug family tripartite tricarboxylate transporter substrate binding protein n=1 Tax=Roseomonas sp. CCTCC AB2023176 TaxID=3342640 RepID=UPI0035D99B1F
MPAATSRRALLAAPALLPAPGASAQGPSPFTRPVRVVVPFPPGSTPDVSARAAAAHFAAAFGQPFVAENRPGAGGTIGVDGVAKSTDGHTIGVTISSGLTTAKALYPALPYDPARDVAPVSLLVRAANLLVVRDDLPARDVAAFVELSRRQPLTYGSTGNGSASHMAMEMLKARTLGEQGGGNLTHVTYRGFPQLAPDLIGGRVDATFAIAAAFLPLIREGKVRALAATAASRIPQAPAVPTMAEAGFPGLESFAWIGLIAPAAMPAATREALEREARRGMAVPETRATLERAGFEVVGGSAAEFRDWAERETREWGELIARLGIQADG